MLWDWVDITGPSISASGLYSPFIQDLGDKLIEHIITVLDEV